MQTTPASTTATAPTTAGHKWESPDHGFLCAICGDSLEAHKPDKAVTKRHLVIHSPRMERRFKLFTTDGAIVYTYGHTGYTLEKADHRQQATSYGSEPELRAKRAAKAELKLAVRVEWREVAPVEMMAVSF